MSFSASQKSIDEILSRNSSYLIPKNQRKYVWSETEWSELFEDIFLIEQTKDYSHFIESFVFSESKNQSDYIVVDGQQRMITISILLCCMVSVLLKNKEDKVASSFLQPYLSGSKDGEEYYKITRDDGPFYLTYLIDELKNNNPVTGVKAEELLKENFGKKDRYNKRLLDCFLFFQKSIDEYIKGKKRSKKETIVELKSKLTACQCIEIDVESDVEGYRVFETLNARGIPLEQHELIKNYLYSYLRSKEKIKNLDSKWSKIMANVATDKKDYFPAFISHYCAHRFGKIGKNDEFKEIRNKVPKSKIEELLTSLYRCSIYYSYIIDPDKYKAEKDSSYSVYVSLKFFHNLNIRQARPLILSLFEAFNDTNKIQKEQFEKSMTLLENFYFMYVVLLKGTTNKVDNTIMQLSKNIFEATDTIDACQMLRDELSKFVSEKDSIKAQFKVIGFSNKNPKFDNSSNKKCVNYIFEKIEKFYDENDELPTIKIASIEHIYNDSEFEDFASYIGNLLPLSKRLNNNISNKSFEEKIAFYKKSNMLCVRKFLEHHGQQRTWGKEDIEKRSEAILNDCFDKIWQF